MANQINASTLTPEQLTARAKFELERKGFSRDEEGRIIFTKEQLLARQKHFEEKKKGYEKRIKNLDEELGKVVEKLSKE